MFADVAGHRTARVAVVANPVAGSFSPELIEGVEELCSEHAESVEVLLTRYGGHAGELARDVAKAVDLIIAVGGDGTVREVVSGLAPELSVAGASAGDGAGEPRSVAEKMPALVVLPGGTGNSNFRSMWDDVPWHVALRSALTGVGARTKQLDLAVLRRQGRLVLLGASTGVFAEATAAARGSSVAGRERYQQALREVLGGFVPYPGRVIVDGAVAQEGYTVLANVGGSRYRAGVYDVLPRSLRDDGLLDVCVIGAEVGAERGLELMRTGAHLDVPGVTYAQGRSITLERLDGRSLWFEHDGEAVPPGGDTSITVDVVAAALPFVVSDSRREG